MNPEIRYRSVHPRIGLYAGGGASHSWLWFIDLFDQFGLYNLVILDEHDVRSGGLKNIDIFCMSGGDTFKIAGCLGKKGADNLGVFFREGGIYMGSCAGAYLPLRSSKSPLDLFNYVNVKISNLTRILPQVRALPNKFCTAYGCEYVFHPVRDEVRLMTNGFVPFRLHGGVIAPLFGGPPMVAEPSSCQILATYSGFTKKTIFLVDEDLASKTLLGKAAVIRKKVDSGVLYLFGPHFEHPHYPIANGLLVDLMLWEMRHRSAGQRGFWQYPELHQVRENFLADLKRHLSNCRIVASGLEMRPVNWLIGKKLYEPGKIRVFLESMWSRIGKLQGYGKAWAQRDEDDLVLMKASLLTNGLRRLKIQMDKGSNTTELATDVFETLNQVAALFFSIYFRTVAQGTMEENVRQA